MSLGEYLLSQLLLVQAQRDLRDTDLVAEIGVTPAVWSNWKNRLAVSKDGLEKVYDRFPEFFVKENSQSKDDSDLNKSSKGLQRLIRSAQAVEATSSAPEAFFTSLADSLDALIGKSGPVAAREPPKVPPKLRTRLDQKE